MATKATDNNAVIIPTINDYTFVKKLGSGSQGVVNLYERKQDNKLFAIKQFSLMQVNHLQLCKIVQ
jgi:serine/threonine protein kinase